MRSPVDLVVGSVGMVATAGFLLALLVVGGALLGVVLGREPAGEP